ncbi:MAG TPA: hypothetical protein VFH49_16925 [Aquabacterium sp.]|nr:hypothetical protein [Aquabacterium sp.]
MALVRLLVMAMGLGFLLCMGMFTLSGEPVWRQRAIQILKWAVVLGLCFVGLFVLRRAAVFI